MICYSAVHKDWSLVQPRFGAILMALSHVTASSHRNDNICSVVLLLYLVVPFVLGSHLYHPAALEQGIPKCVTLSWYLMKHALTQEYCLVHEVRPYMGTSCRRMSGADSRSSAARVSEEAVDVGSFLSRMHARYNCNAC